MESPIFWLVCILGCFLVSVVVFMIRASGNAADSPEWKAKVAEAKANIAKRTKNTTIPGAQRVDTHSMSDRRLWEQIEYNTRMSADVLHRMWVLVVIIVVLNVIAAIAMVASQ